jgi:drug/metabolite transporter (DMT)-like permease
MLRNSAAMPGDNVVRGILLGVLAYSLFSIHDATNKWLVATLPVWQVMFFRSVTIVAGALAVGRTPLISRALSTPLKLPLLGRGLLTMVAWLCYYTAAPHMPLAQLMTLYFSAPILTTLLAIPLLGERVTGARWISVLVGFAGVVVASDPFGLRVSWSTALVLVAALFWGYAIILMRQIARAESSLLQILYQNLTFLAFTGPLCLLDWVPPTGFDLLLLLAIGVLGGLGQFVLFEGARLAPASVMATVEYTSLVWAFLLGFLVWGDLPTLAISCGAALILASGLFMVVMERRAGRRARMP